MVELAKAYVQVIPSMKGARKEIERELGGSKLGKKTGLDFSKGFTGAAKSMGGKVVDIAGKTIKTGLVAGAAVTGGLMATAINKGFGRLSSIEQATKSLEGMGLSAGQVAAVMENANDAVLGTAFGLDAAATAAKGLVAAGVEPGEDLERVLTLVGDSAAQAGTSMEDMGLIWGSVYAKGKLQGQEALQLMERGIPIYQMVADELEITAEEAMELGRKGEISADLFATAMENTFAGSALKMGDTVKGSFANTGAALGRLGEKILKGPFADAPKMFQAVTDELNALGPTVEDLSDRTYNAIKGVWEILSGKGHSNALADAFGEINASKITETLLTIREDLNTTRASAATSLQAIQKEFLWLNQAATLDNLLSAVERGSSLFVTFADGAARVAAALAPALSYAGQAATILGGGILDSIETLAPVTIDFAVAVADAGSAMSRLLVPGASAAVAVLEPVVDIFAKLLGWAADLPTPILTAGIAFASLKTNMGPLPKLAEALKTGFDKAKGGAETFAIQAMVASDATGKVGDSAITARGIAATAFTGIGNAAKGLAGTLKAAFLSNPIGIVLVAATTALSFFTSQAEKSKKKINDLADTFDEFGNVTEATRDKIYDNLLADENWFGLGDNLADRFRNAGFEISEVIDAISGDSVRLRALTDELERMAVAAEEAGNPQKAERFRDMADALNKQADDFGSATERSQEYRDAMGKSAASVQEHTDAIQRQIDAQRAVNDLFAASANAALGAREAERAYADTVERSREVLEDAEASERDRQAALDDIATSAHRLAQRQNENNASQSVLNDTMRQGREDFIALAEDMGYTADEAAALADELGLIEGTYTANIEADSGDALATLDELQVDIDDTTGTVIINGNPVSAETKLSDLVETIDAETGEVLIDGNRFPADATVSDLVAFIGTQAGTVEIDGNNFPANDVLSATLMAIRNGEESVTIAGKDYPAQDLLKALKLDIRGTTEQVTIDGNPRPAYMQVDATGKRIRGTREAVTIDGNSGPADGSRRAMAQKIGNTRAAMQISGNRGPLDSVLAGIQGAILGTAYIRLKSIGGPQTMNKPMADGGVLEFYAHGGLREKHVAQIAPAGAMRIWAEPETGGEAYIPLAQSKRARSEAILAEVAERFGYQLAHAERYANGGTAGSSAHGSAVPVMPSTVVLRVGDREFVTFLEEVADSRPGVAAANDLVMNGARYSKTRGM